MSKPNRRAFSWRRLFTLTTLAAYIYVFLEWLFFATMPSFLDAYSGGKKLEIFLITGLVLTAFVLPCLAILRMLEMIPGPTKRRQVFLILGVILPAFIAASVGLLLVDNFTYTLFKIGIVTARGIWRAVYAGMFVVLFAVWYREILLSLRSGSAIVADAGTKTAKSRSGLRRRVPVILAAGLVAASLVVGVVRIAASAPIPDGDAGPPLRRPNIILLGGDGLSVDNMSLYGYERETTPRLDQLAETGLVAENNFTNAGHTTGSVFSILTGKNPVQTRLLNAPNVLQGQDAYQHLPGILKRSGYTTVEIGFPYYCDAYEVNLQEGFDEVNGRSIGQGEFFRLARQYRLEDVGYFLQHLTERILDRLQHIFFLRDMPDPWVNPNMIEISTDEKRISRLIHLLQEADQPLFAHVHLVDTHGPRFHPTTRFFSAGEEQESSWMTDFHDDALLDFDSSVGELVDELARSGLLDETVIVIYSDHGVHWRIDGRVPLLFRFPHGDYAGRLNHNTQNLDIAPTLLDYMGIETPSWMSGLSLLKGEPAADRLIISMNGVESECLPTDVMCAIVAAQPNPPFYQFNTLQAVVCQKLYSLDLLGGIWTEKEVLGHTAPCGTDLLPGGDQIRRMAVDYLRFYGFDVSSLE